MILKLENVSFSYKGNSSPVLDSVNAEFEEGKIYAVTGESGSGKTTLLSLIAGLQGCSGGLIKYKGKDLREINKDDYRSKQVGIIFQSYNLLLQDTAAENVELALNLSGSKIKNKKEEAYRLLEKVSLSRETANRRILKLSGGEQQRVAIARSLSHDSALMVADEPTGNLDAKNEEGIMKIFTRLAHEENKCVIIVTHSPSVASYADIRLKINAGGLFAEN